MAAPAVPQLPPTRRRVRRIRRPNLGVYLNRPSLDLDPRALIDCLNIRIKDAHVLSENMGWVPFPEGIGDGNQFNLDSRQVLYIDAFFTRAGAQTLIFGNQKDLFKFNEGANVLNYITPIYATGTVDNTPGPDNLTITGTGTLWDTARTTTPTAGGYGKNAVSGMEISFGSAVEVLPTATWHEIDAVASDTVLTILTDPGVIGPGASYTIRQTFTGDNFDIWDGEVFPDAQEDDEDKMFITNGVEMVKWDSNDLTTAWFFPGFSCRGFREWKQIMLAFHVTEAGEVKPQTIKSSRLNFPEDYTTEEATEFVSASGVSELLNLTPLSDAVVAYYERAVSLISFVGPPLFWVTREAVPGRGLLAPGALVDFGDFHEFLSNDRAYRFDGVTLEEIQSQVFREVLRKHAPNRSDRAYAHIDEESGEVIWSIPLTTDGSAADEPPMTGYVSHYLEHVSENVQTPMTIRDWPFTASGFFARQTGSLRFSDLNVVGTHEFDKVSFTWDDRALQAAFPFNIVGDGNGDIWIVGIADTQHFPSAQTDGTFTGKIQSFARFPRIALGDAERWSLLHWIEPYSARRGGTYGLNCVPIMFDQAEADVVFATDATQFYDLQQLTDRYVPFRIVGRYAEFLFGTDAKNQPWDIAGYALSASVLGRR